MAKKQRCKLCKNLFTENEMSDEHYPARSAGNNDVLTLYPTRFIDMLTSEKFTADLRNSFSNGENLEEIANNFIDKVTEPTFPLGRTARTLCKNCNNLLGEYDDVYLKFYKNNGESDVIRGFAKTTKLKIIKAIYGKFISIPEANKEAFDFLNFVLNSCEEEYSGVWKLYFVRRDESTDLFGLQHIDTGKIQYNDKKVVYELSDDRFIYNLMNFEKHKEFKMTNIFEILNKKYKIYNGVGDLGGYHGMILLNKLK